MRVFLAIAVHAVRVVQALAQDAEQRMTVLHLSQTAERSVIRDLLRIELRVEETGADARSVQTAINRRMAAALDRARQVQGVRVETGSYNVGEERPQNGPTPLARQPVGDFDRERRGFDAEAGRCAAIRWSVDFVAHL